MALLGLWAAACSRGEGGKPDLPASVSPGWTLGEINPSAPPGRLPASATPPVCWKGEYRSDVEKGGDASVWICGYPSAASALDASQTMPSLLDEVKFQVGLNLAVVEWRNASQTEVTALVLAIQRALPAK